MTAARAAIRRGLAISPRVQSLFQNFELEWLASTIASTNGAVGKYLQPIPHLGQTGTEVYARSSDVQHHDGSQEGDVDDSDETNDEDSEDGSEDGSEEEIEDNSDKDDDREGHEADSGRDPEEGRGETSSNIGTHSDGVGDASTNNRGHVASSNDFEALHKNQKGSANESNDTHPTNKINSKAQTVMILRSHFDVEDICIGVTDANRGESSLQTIGFFLNLLPLRFNVQKDVKFSDLVAKTAQHCRTAQANMEVPFDVILDKANVVREPTSTPIFQVAINYRQGKFSKIPLGGRNLEFKDGIEAQSPYDLAFSITPNNDTTYVQIVAREDLYTREGTDTLLSAYMALLHDASRDVSKCLGSINLYDQVGIDKALSLGYGDVVDYDWPSTLTEKVDETIKRYPHDVAVKDGTIQLTYGEVAAKVNGLASIIQS
ncbi:hypothetical protein FVEG_13422 [Fusarium verticillioides 7600]|uniref:Condensation domain-containing protein n=1 Tax=Gibberella moniliformis (strain M3125 / FGSC 7600) TaxID=334819 RepID=W7MVU5_GIBM7|nr:hypothetical protein FVEG_13422 [Fusarium verticillioides 7600]EWG55423.1 hypothetical protein FVEG_13422 [Fusarium verticillioides 7600]